MRLWDSDCLSCKHLNRLDEISSKNLKCKAFPKGIPSKFISNLGKKAFRHDKPYEGDNGIRYEPFTYEDLEKFESEQGIKLLPHEWKDPFPFGED